MNLVANQRKHAQLWLLTIVIGFFLSLFYFYYYGVICKLDYPYNTFLFDPSDQFADFKNVVKLWYQYLPNPPSETTIYFPFAYLLVAIFRFFLNLFSLNIILLIFFASFFCIFLKTSLARLNFMEFTEKMLFLTVTLFLTFPFLFAFDRANLELYVYGFISLAFYYLKKENQTASGIFLGLATAMKLFPAVLIFVFVFQKKWKSVVFTLISTVVSTFLALLYLPQSIFFNLSRLLANLTLYNNEYVLDNGGLDFGHSLFGMIKIVNSYTSQVAVERLLMIYTIFVFLILGGIIYFLSKQPIKFWQLLTIFIIIINLFPAVSADYKLIHLFTPFLFWLEDRSAHEKIQIKYWLIWGLLFIPKRYFLLDPYYDGVIIDPILMMILFLNIYKDIIKQRQIDEKVN